VATESMLPTWEDLNQFLGKERAKKLRHICEEPFASAVAPLVREALNLTRDAPVGLQVVTLLEALRRIPDPATELEVATQLAAAEPLSSMRWLDLAHAADLAGKPVLRRRAVEQCCVVALQMREHSIVEQLAGRFPAVRARAQGWWGCDVGFEQCSWCNNKRNRLVHHAGLNASVCWYCLQRVASVILATPTQILAEHWALRFPTPDRLISPGVRPPDAEQFHGVFGVAALEKARELKYPDAGLYFGCWIIVDWTDEEAVGAALGVFVDEDFLRATCETARNALACFARLGALKKRG